MSMATVTTLGFSIRSSWDGSGTRAAQRSLIQLAATARATQASMSRSSLGMQGLTTAAVALAPALAPIAQVAGAAGAGIASMVATSGSALTIYGAAMAGAIARTMQMAQAGRALDPSQKSFIASVNGMKAAWDRFVVSTSPTTLRAATTVVQGVTAGIGKLKPVVDAVAPSVQRVATAFRNWAAGAGMDRFINVLTSRGVPAFNALLNAGRNTLAVLGIGMRDFSGLGVRIAQSLERGSQAMRGWAEGGGFQRFLERVRQNAPAVQAFFSALGAALRNLTAAMGGLGPLSLTVATALLRIVAALPPGVIQAMVVAWTAWRVAMMAHTVAMAAHSAAVVINTAAMNGNRIAMLAVAAAQRIAVIGMTAFRVAWLLLNTTFLSTPLGWIVLAIGALVAAIVLIATRTTWFQTIWRVVWEAVRTAAVAVWNFLRSAWQGFVNAISLVWTVGSAVIRAAWNGIWNAMRTVAETVWNGLRLYFTVWWTVVRTVFTVGINAIRAIWNAVWGALRTAAEAVWNGLRLYFTVWWTVVRTVFTVGINAIRTVWNAVWGALRTLAQTVFNALRTFFTTWWAVTRAMFTAGLTAIRTLWTTVWNAIRTVATTVFNAIRTAATTFWAGVRAAFTTGLNAVRTLWTTVWNAIRTLVINVWNNIRTAGQAFWTMLTAMFRNGLNAVRTVWTSVWNAIRTLVINVWNNIRTAGAAFWRMLSTMFSNALRALRTLWTNTWNAIRELVIRVWNNIRTAGAAFWRMLSAMFRNALNALRRFWNTTWDAIGDFAVRVWNNIRAACGRWLNSMREAINNWIDAIKRAFANCWESVRDTASRLWNSIGNTIEGAINGIIGIVNKIIGGFNRVADAVNIDVNIPTLGTVQFATGGMVPQFAGGGNVKDLRGGGALMGYSPGRDTVPALLSPGEGVLTPEAVRGLGGPGFINSANREFAGHRGAGAGATPLSRWTGTHDYTHPQQMPFATGGMVPVQHFAVGGMTASALARAGVGMGLISQGEYSHGSLSAGTHAGGGVVDISSTSPALLARLRAAGFAAWIRSGPGWVGNEHIHAVLMNHPALSGPARAQVASFLAGGSGLGVGGGGGIGFSLPDFGEILQAIALGKGHPMADMLGSFLGMLGKGAIEKAFDWAGDLLDNWKNPAGEVGKLFLGMGKEMLEGFINFLVKKDSDATPSFTDAMGAGGGVARWSGLAAQALKLAGLDPNQLGRFLSLMAAESGGNPNAINGWDSNARMGQASRGLMQVIPATFAAYRHPAVPGGIMDPLANMTAAARYIKARYGGQVPGSPYASGTNHARRGWHLVGENGPEMRYFRGGERVANARRTYGELNRMGGDAGVVFEKGAFQIDARGASVEAVREMETNMVPKLRLAVQAGVGKRR